ncbi:MAG: WecB/TagA/CpsF family glycosyltransferase [Patescibacteria group bacterium]
MERKTVTLLGVRIDAVTSRQAVELMLNMLESGHLKRFFHAGGQHHVMTPNSEMLVEASHNRQFRKVLNETSLNVPDSVGLLHMARFTGQKLPERVAGVDTVRTLCRKLSRHHPVFLLGAGEGIAEKAAKELKKMNTQLQVVGMHSGSPRDEDAEEIINKIKEAKPHLLLVAFGAPAQDIWIHKHLKGLPSVRVAIGVGGTFDFLAGKQKRAPLWMRTVGLEWLGRLVREPKRIGRIFRAVVVFPMLVLFRKKKL